MRLSRAVVLVFAAGMATQCNASAPAPERLAKNEAALAWSSGASGQQRYFHAAVAMKDGRVLVAGGFTSGYSSHAEIYDPATGTWSAAGYLSKARSFPIGARLPSGKIMIAGGEVSAAVGEKTVDIYDPATGTWSAGPPLAAGSTRGSTISLADGRVLLLAAYAPGAIYDEASSTWTATNPAINRDTPGMVRLSSGKILVVGGSDSSGPNSIAELFDPATGWSTTGFTKVPRTGHVTALLPGDKVLVAGGDYAGAISSAEIWDPATGKWSDAPSMSVGRKLIGGGKLPDGKVLVGFGTTTATGEVFDPVANVWRPALGGKVPRIYAQAVTTDTGSVVFTGGMNASTFALIGIAEVFTQGALGSTCTSAGECASGFCVDGVCCNSACSGTCQACNLATSLGTCATVDGAAPHPPRTCAPFDKCVSGACVTSCSVNSDCASDRYCIAPNCVPKTANGLACATNDQCASGFCVDGVCCSSACTDKCAACDVVGSFGDCAPVDGQPRGGRAPCTGTAVGTTCGEKCDGTDTTACHYPPSSISCGADGCTDGVETRAGACDGTGLCHLTTASCGVYACSGTTCKTTCGADTDCKPGYYCNGSACVAVEGLGSSCTSASSCKTGACVEGVCCGSASCPDGSSCKVAGHEGSCVKLAGQACAISEECGTGFCVDGVCCDSACDGNCEACDVAGSKGTCSPVVGAPHAGRKACDAGGGDVCKARTCDGVERKSCAGFASGASVKCRDSICKGDVLALEGRCDGAGACEAEKTSSCLPFACVGRACATSCSADDQCGSDFRCEGGACVSRNAKCSEDGLSSVPLGGTPKSCEPYRCGATGECQNTCETSAQCAPGFVCDPSSTSCVAGAVSNDSGGGCSMGNRPAPFASTMLGLLVAIAITRRSQRRNRAWFALLACAAVIACTSSRPDRTEPTALSAIRATHAFDARLREAVAPTRAASEF
ncbi:MAG: Kelch repeat-containing protein, partial [Polyangiales bacterium]